MSKSEPLVSIVTPVYNGERFLRNCIESVLAQTYSNWDYTIVNNCSTDRTLEIAQEYAAKDPRIKGVITNPTFVRVIENHNHAFRQISPDSKYCKVVAADDMLMPECLEKMVCLAEEHPNVGVVGAYGLQEEKVVWQGLPYSSPVICGREAARSYMMGRMYVFGTPTSVLFRSDIVRSRHTFFNESNLHADTEACLGIMEKNDFGFVHQILTRLGVREDSLTSMTNKLNSYYPCVLDNLVRYGPKFFTETELNGRLSELFHSYYWYLGKEVFKNRDAKFWDFHRVKLTAMGYRLSRLRLARYALWVSLDLLFNPKTSSGRPLHHWRRKPSLLGVQHRIECQ